MAEGCLVGDSVGSRVGLIDGDLDGVYVGYIVGDNVGYFEGGIDGVFVGVRIWLCSVRSHVSRFIGRNAGFVPARERST